MHIRVKDRAVVAVLWTYGVYSTVVGLAMIAVPGPFFETVGGFGVFNAHYVFDLASFELPLGLFYFAAVKWASWRVPMLVFATLHYALHTVSHLIDIADAVPPWIGVFDFAAVAVGTVIHVLALAFAIQVQRATRP